MQDNSYRVQHVNMLRPNYRRVLKVRTLLWIVTLIFFWEWWIREGSQVTVEMNGVQSLVRSGLYIVFTFANGYSNTILAGFYLLCIWFMRCPLPEDLGYLKRKYGFSPGRVALITTHVAEDESIQKVIRQLKALGKVTHPHDSWILVDKKHSDVVKALANAHGVFYFSRYDPMWPAELRAKWSREKGHFQKGTKSGSVNAWLDALKHLSEHPELYEQLGSSLESNHLEYEFFVQFDVDHRPHQNYLDKTLPYMADPRIGYVMSPSVYDNWHDGWTAIGAAEQEFTLQGVMQPGFFGMSEIPFIIGSHCLYRTKAIKRIGGFQRTRAEDHLDTMFLGAKKYKGVFVPEVIAMGDGPENFETYMGQQFAWAYSVVQIFMYYTPKLLPKLPLVPAVQFLFAQTWYLLWPTCLLLLFLIPIFSLFIDVPISEVSYLDFLVHNTPLWLVTYSNWKWSRRWHPPKGLPFTWRGVLLHIVRSPIVFLAVIQALLKIKKPYMLTRKGMDKGENAPFRLAPMSLILGLVFMAIASCWVYMLIYGYGKTQGYMFFTLMGAFFYLLVIDVALVKDIQNLKGEGVGMLRIVSIRAKPIIVLSLFTLAFVVTSYVSTERIVQSFLYPITTQGGSDEVPVERNAPSSYELVELASSE